MNFPTRELEIVRLAQDVSKGFRDNPETFPAPPAGPDAIDQALADYNAARDGAIASQASRAKGTALKRETLRALTRLVRANVRYAESLANGDGATLQLVGWGARRSPTPNGLEGPGQVITLEVRQEGSSWVTLGWREPFDGGAVSAYRVQRRKRDGGEWMDVGTSVETAVTLSDQEAGVEFEYRVIALNKAGEGPPSNGVRAVL
jgi:hypothetical protein